MENSYIEQVQIRKKNKIDGLHPKVKAVILVLYVICTFVISTVKVTQYELPLYLILWFGVLLLLFAATGQFMKCIRGCRLVFTVFLVIFFAQSLIIPGGKVFFKLGFLTVEQAGLRKSADAADRQHGR